MLKNTGYGLLSNPLTAAGLGLMAVGGPSLMPVSFGQALNKGLLAGQEAHQKNVELGLLRDQRKEESLLNELKRRKYEQDLSDPMRGLMAVSAGQTIVNPLTGEVMYSAPPKPQSNKPNQAEKYLEVKYGPNWRGNPKAIAEWEKIILKPAVQVMPAPSVRAMPGGGLATVRSTKDGGFVVEEIPGTNPRENARAELGEVAKAYWELGKNTSGFDAKGREEFAQLRNRLVMMLARANNPTGVLTDADVQIAKEQVPSPFGPYDAWVFDAAMGSFINANTSQFSGADTTESTQGRVRYQYDPKTKEMVKVGG